MPCEWWMEGRGVEVEWVGEWEWEGKEGGGCTWLFSPLSYIRDGRGGEGRGGEGTGRDGEGEEDRRREQQNRERRMGERQSGAAQIISRHKWYDTRILRETLL